MNSYYLREMQLDWHEYFTYDEATGDLIWKPRPPEHFKNTGVHKAWNGRYPGTVAGRKYYKHITRRPHQINITVSDVRLDGGMVNDGAHRVVYEMTTGPIPAGIMIDHRDGNPFNNKRSNLRMATGPENGRNARRSVNNTSGYKGVSWHEATQKWGSSIHVDGAQKHLGVFADPWFAHAVYCKAAIHFYGDFARFS